MKILNHASVWYSIETRSLLLTQIATRVRPGFVHAKSYTLGVKQLDYSAVTGYNQIGWFYKLMISQQAWFHSL